MNNTLKAEDIDVVLLCGGEGRRLKPVLNGRPKALADINGRPFLDILIAQLEGAGFRRFVLCTGHKAELISRYCKDKETSVEIILSEEKEPLGTAGAIKNAQSYIKSEPFMVMNGDSLCSLDFADFINYHTDKKALSSIVLINSCEACEYGLVNLSNSGEITGFHEKTDVKKGNLVSAGIYLFEQGIFSMIASDKTVSLEYELFPRIIDKGFYGYRTEGKFIDLGTPDRYKEAQVSLKGCL
ncbi:MAG: NTP transferase domain-containing protein [Candidatus Omnitrophota bacterium]|nr:MAG: NTP transferase domain-containing protein [Candidatus Omnitrophota bacterium]